MDNSRAQLLERRLALTRGKILTFSSFFLVWKAFFFG